MEKSFFSRSPLRSDILVRLLSFHSDTSWGQLNRIHETNFFQFWTWNKKILHKDNFIPKELIWSLLGIQRSSDMSFFSLVLLSDAQKTLSLLKFLLATVTEGNMEGSLLPSCLGSVDFTYFLHEAFELTLSHLVLPHWFHHLFRQHSSHTMQGP